MRRHELISPVPAAQLQDQLSRAVLAPRHERIRSATQKHRVSVVVPSFNQIDFLPRTLNCLLNQSYQDLEIIVIDGGSSDGSVDVIRDYSQHLAYWSTEPDEGQSDALNKGFAKATGDILCWLNADDLLLPDAVDHAVGQLQTHPLALIVYGDWLNIDEADHLVRYEYAFGPSLGQLSFEGFFANAQSMFWRSSLHERFGQFDVELHRTMDYDMILRFMQLGGKEAFLRVDRPYGAFRRHGGQKTQGFDNAVKSEREHIANRYGITAHDSLKGRFLRPIYRARRAYWYLRRGGPELVMRRLSGSA